MVSDHIAGSDKKNICITNSIGFGIKYIEKHITFDRKGRLLFRT